MITHGWTSHQVSGVSLGSGCWMDFRRLKADEIVLLTEARSGWFMKSLGSDGEDAQL